MGHYFDRAARCAHGDRREAFSSLVAEVRRDGVDPGGAWTKPSSEVTGLAAALTPARATRDLPALPTMPPLQRDPCALDCREHEEHVYIACFDEPTRLADRDHHRDDPELDYPVRHYVGWTSQQPPVKRVNQHRVTCRDHLVLLVPGSERDEAELKREGRCPRCGDALWYFLAKNREASAP